MVLRSAWPAVEPSATGERSRTDSRVIQAIWGCTLSWLRRERPLRLALRAIHLPLFAVEERGPAAPLRSGGAVAKRLRGRSAQRWNTAASSMCDDQRN